LSILILEYNKYLLKWNFCHKGTKAQTPGNIMTYEKLSEEEERIATAIVEAAYQVHKELGPGLLEKVYEICLAHLLRKMGFEVDRQVDIPIVFDGIQFDEGLRLDLLINKKVICETKAIDLVNPVWEAQILSHLKLTKHRLGFLINFNVPVIRKGIRRYRM
jgi:GxxExxY protein